MQPLFLPSFASGGPQGPPQEKRWTNTGRKTTLADGSKRTLYERADSPGKLYVRRMDRRDGRSTLTYAWAAHESPYAAPPALQRRMSAKSVKVAPRARPKRSLAPEAVVFLGGACNPTTWRRDVAIPLLERAGIAYHNPQVDDWTPELEAAEASAKLAARWLLFVIDGQTRAVASMVEAAFYSGLCPHRVVLVVERPYANALGDAAGVVKDLSRGRAYVGGEMVAGRGVPIFATVEEAIRHITNLFLRGGAATGPPRPKA